MIDRYHIIDHGDPRPDAEHILFCDGTEEAIFRPEADLELSHWRPNRTPDEYRAGTSTEICFRFLDNPRPGTWTAAVNNHIDVDGILSVYALVHSDHALAHRQTIIQAAEMGDFWGWGERSAQRLFQGLTFLMQQGGSAAEVYEEAFRRIPRLIDGSDPQVGEINVSLAPLNLGIELVQQGRIVRREIDARLPQYVVPLAVAGGDDARAAYVPQFNEAISSKALLWPQVRACTDAERVSLVSIERKTGWFHDFWFPGYLWADTEGLWIPPGFTYHDGMSSYEIQNDRLIAAFEQLQQQETATGQWALGGTSLPFGKELQDRFPLVGRFLDGEGRVAASRLSPDQVAEVLRGVFN
jgi:hypothetical protein